MVDADAVLSKRNLQLIECLLRIFACFLSSADFFFKINFFLKKIFQEYHQSVKQFGSDQARRFVGYDLGPICLRRL